MKTITEVARDLGVSRQTLYNAIVKADNVDIETLTKGRRGKARLFDDESISIVKELLSKHCQSDVKEKQVDNELDNAKKELDDLRRDLASAEKRITEQAEELEKLREEVDKLRENNDILIRTNATNALTIQRLQEKDQKLLAEVSDERRGGWIKRAMKRITGKGEDKKK